jgi:outer membrane protein assembly factor BamB
MRSHLGRALLVVVVLLSVAWGARFVRAGDGSINVQQKPTGELQRADVSLKVFVDLPRTAEEIAAMNEQLVNASGLLCDYTDGLFRIGQVEYVRHPLREKEADIWWFRRQDRATSGFGFGKGAQCGQPGVVCIDDVPQVCAPGIGPVFNPRRASGHLNIYGTGPTTQAGETIAHELGHLLFEFGDHYPNQRGPGFLDPLWPVASAVSGARELEEFQSGLSFYRSTRAFLAPGFEPQIFKDVVRPADVPAGPAGAMYESPAGIAWWLANNSVMQQDSGQVCRALALGLEVSPEQLNPVLWLPQPCRSNADENGNLVPDDCEAVTQMQCSISGVSCVVDADCGGAGGTCNVVDGFPFCTTLLHANSELSTAGSHELDRFDHTFGESFTPGPSASRVQGANDLVIQGFLYAANHEDPGNNSVNRDWVCHGFDEMDPTGKSCADPIDEACSADLATEGTENEQFECAGNLIQLGSRCPFSTSPHYPALVPMPTAWCDHCGLANSVDCPAFSATCGDGVVAAPARDGAGNLMSAEQCDTAGNVAAPVIDPATGLPLRCDAVTTPWPVVPPPAPSPRMAGGLVHCQPNCYFDLSRCTYPFLGPVEDRDGDNFTHLSEVRDQSTAWAFAEVFDQAGRVDDRADPSLAAESSFPQGRLNLLAMGPSNHGLFAFFRRMFRYRVTDPADPMGRAWPNPASAAGHVYHEVWELIIALDAAELAGENSGVDGQMHVVRRFELEFENDYVGRDSTLLSINGVSCSAPGSLCQDDAPANWPIVYLGYTTNPTFDPYVGTGPCQLTHAAWDGVPLCTMAQAPTGAFVRLGQGLLTPQQFSLRIDLRNLRAMLVEDSPSAAGTTFVDQAGGYKDRGGPVSMYARNGLTEVDGQLHEVPQYGSLNWRLQNASTQVGQPCAADLQRCVETYDLFGFNEETKRWEASRDGIDLLTRQVLGHPVATAAYPRIHPPLDDSEALVRTNEVLADPDQFVDSDWSVLSKVMCNRWGVIVDPADIPDDGAEVEPFRDPAVCAAPNILPFPDTVDFDQDTQIIFVLDRSGSMGTEDAALNEVTSSRLDFVKNAARRFIADVQAAYLQAGAEFGPKIGLVWYGDQAEVRIPDASDTACDCPAGVEACTNPVQCPGSSSCFHGRCLIEMPRLSTTECPPPSPSNPDPCDRITPGQFEDDMKLAFEPGGENPTPDGWTASGQALLAATEMFNPGRPNPGAPGTLVEPTRVIVFLSDGLHNRPTGGHCLGAEFCQQRQGSECTVGTCGGSGTAQCSFRRHGEKPGCWPTSEADELYSAALNNLEARDIFLFDIPLQNEADAAGASIRVGRTSGEVYDAVRANGEDTVPFFSQASTALYGRQLARTHSSIPYLVGSASEGVVIYEIPVEQGARSLTVTVSDYDATRDIFDTTFSPGVPSGLVSPGSSTVDHPLDVNDTTIEFGPAYATFHILNPTAGVWRFFDIGGGQVGLWLKDHLRLYLTAHVESDLPRCHAELSSRITDDASPIYVTAQAFFERPILSGAQYFGTWMGPDMLLRTLVFERDDRTGMYQAAIDPSSFVGRGAYTVNVTCKVEDGAVVHPGELPPGAPDPAPDVALEPTAFTRSIATSFFVDSDEAPPVPGLTGNNQDPAVLDDLVDQIGCPIPGTCSIPVGFAPVEPFVGDADGDGISNEDEPDPDVDTDGDGNVDVNDPDANNNSIPDGQDPDITDSGGGPGGGGPGGGGPGGGGLTPSTWPMFHKTPSHHGRSPHPGPTVGFIGWQKSIGSAVLSSPVIDITNRIYVGSNDNRLYALEPDGEVAWSFLTGGDVDSTPALTNIGTVVFGSDDDKVRALNVATGAQVWQFNTTLDVDSSPVVSDGVVYVGSDDNKLHALDLETGQELWHYTTLGDIDSSPAIMPDGSIVVGSDDDFLYRLKPDLGLTQAQRLIWKRNLGGLDVESSPAIGGAPDFPIYVGSESGRLYKLASATGNIVWQYNATIHIDSSPALAPDGSIVFGDNSGVRALNPNGSLKWSYTIPGSVDSSPAVSAQGHVYVGSDDGFLYALRGEAGLTAQQRLLFKMNLGDDVNSSPALDEGVVYVGSNSGKVYEITAPPPGTPPASNCSEHNHGGTSYWFCTDALSWQGARDKCRALGYDLATVDNAVENGFVKSHTVADAWLGGTDQAVENVWRWAFSATQFWQGTAGGAPVGGAYANFNSGQPDQSTQDCLALRTSDGKWTDESCSQTRDYVCENVPDVMGVSARFYSGAQESQRDLFGCAAAPGTSRWSFASVLATVVFLIIRRRRTSNVGNRF